MSVEVNILSYFVNIHSIKPKEPMGGVIAPTEPLLNWHYIGVCAAHIHYI